VKFKVNESTVKFVYHSLTDPDKLSVCFV